MSDLNLVILSGRLVEDPDMVETKNSGLSICRFTIAVNRHMGDGNEKTAFVPVTVFDKQAEICHQYLTKGRSVMVRCELETSTYESDQGKRKRFDFVAREVNFLDKPESTDKPAPTPSKRTDRDTETDTAVSKFNSRYGNRRDNDSYKGRFNRR